MRDSQVGKRPVAAEEENAEFKGQGRESVE